MPSGTWHPFALVIAFHEYWRTKFFNRRTLYAPAPEGADVISEYAKARITDGYALLSKCQVDLRILPYEAHLVTVKRGIAGDPDKRLVDMEAQMCTCGYFQEWGNPCYHALAVMKRERRSQACAGCVTPIIASNIENDNLCPPALKRAGGRQKERGGGSAPIWMRLQRVTTAGDAVAGGTILAPVQFLSSVIIILFLWVLRR
ncbi:hypothetical protein BDK51DRAFT_37424 [Blyttiomyces helicus]|uniref:SWIM-type domain-containing protein n=1 Tax=Blyttiomyces helicus TaxID=388810 RepID=A0A4P9WCV7_9FUNG|nr:hypothetical protein BDK51DRAFT_37424 [Blyttiomyces helicus]|eukprot:RKO90491.1 hypothetical protein BDK51DRAFT_37424 [Blyttiomyces helicus]